MAVSVRKKKKKIDSGYPTYAFFSMGLNKSEFLRRGKKIRPKD